MTTYVMLFNDRNDRAATSRPALVGDWLRDHRRLILGLQWVIVAAYVFLLIVPLFLPLPDYTAHIWNHLTVFAQFAFWGIWWPFVLVSMVLVGRTWCGILCPEGTLTEFASRFSLNLAIPRWIRWGGWPFVAFAGTTIYGQMISVYQYPAAAALVLGGSSVAAMAVGLLYARGKRVWCRYLCPVNGVFGLLAKLAPVHFRSDPAVWHATTGHAPPSINCAPLLPLRALDSASACHNCGRCSGHRGAIALQPRSPNSEIVERGDRDGSTATTTLLIFGMIGLAMGAFQWSASPWFITIKQALATWLVEHNVMGPLATNAPWWLLTHYAQQNDVFSWLDGALLVAYIMTTSALVGTAVWTAIWLSSRTAGVGFHHLALSLVPLAGAGVFLGLSSMTISLLRAEGISTGWVSPARALLLTLATGWTLWLGGQITKRYSIRRWRQALVLAGLVVACVLIDFGWVLLFWLW